MAQTVSQAFKEKIRDGISEQSALVVMKDLFFSASDISNGISISQFFNTSDDLTFGDCPSDTLDFTIIAGGMLAGYSFGEAKVYFGVKTASESYVFGDTNAHIEVDGDIYSAKTGGGLYKNDTLVDSGEYISLVSDGTNIYAIGTTSAVRMNKGSSAVYSYTPNNFMGQKLQKPLSAVFDGSTAYVWDGEHLLTYEYVPMGVYNIERPRSTVGQTVEIQDAHDRMALFDVDASEFLSTLTYPITLSAIYTRLCDYIGVPYVSSTFLYSDTSYSSSPFPDNSFSCRQLLSWIAERARRVAHFNRIGQLDLITYGDTVEESITAQDISQNGFSVAEYDTRRVTGVLLKSSNGASLSYGTMKNPYQIMGNPLINAISSDDLTAYRAIRTYVPMEFEILEADPSIDIGDIVNVQPLVEDYNMLTDSFGVAYAVWQEWFLLYGHDDVVVGNGDTPKVYGKAFEGDVAYAVPSPVYPVPLMNREIVFNGFCRAKYTITGNEKRTAELDGDTKYNANATPITQEGVFNRLVGNDLAQGIYLEGGKIYINAEYINAGTISADLIYGGTLSGAKINIGNGTFTVSSEGTVTAKDMHITGGYLDVQAPSELTPRVVVTSGAYVSQVQAGQFTVLSASGHAHYGSRSVIFSSDIDDSTIYAEYGQDHVKVSYGSTIISLEPRYSRVYISQNGTVRVNLNDGGLYFYNADGTQAKYYPAR